jgi:hypothetical protein
MRTKILAALLTLASALWGAAAWADVYTEVAEPFARSAEIYTEGYQAFAPSGPLIGPEDLAAQIIIKEGMPWGAAYKPVVIYRLKDPGRFHFELQTPDPLDLGGPSVGN